MRQKSVMKEQRTLQLLLKIVIKEGTSGVQEDSVKRQKSNSRSRLEEPCGRAENEAVLAGLCRAGGLGEPMVSEGHQRQGWGENLGFIACTTSCH